MPLLSKLTTYAGFLDFENYQGWGLMYTENSESSLVFVVNGSYCPILDINGGTWTYRVFQTCRIPCHHTVFIHSQMLEFTSVLYSSSYHETVDLVLKLCGRWTWAVDRDLDQNTPAIPSPDYTKRNRQYRLFRNKINTVIALLGLTAAEDITNSAINVVHEVILTRLLS